MEVDFKAWSQWIQEGWYVSYIRDSTRFYEHVIARDLAHYLYSWPATLAALSTGGPVFPDDLEITRGYDKEANTNQIWQMIFGIKGQVYIYVELPTDLHRHGLAKLPKPSAAMREVSHFEEYFSPYHEPSFLTEHFLMRPECIKIGFDAYNPQVIAMPDVKLNIFIAKLITERIGTETNGTITPAKTRWSDTLDRLQKRLIPFRPITLQPVRAPVESIAGE